MSDEILGEIKCLDHGFIRLVDIMGDDARICAAARTSYHLNAGTPEKDRHLIRFMMREKHSSPFEMGEVCFHIKLPLFVMQQHLRHRTANVNAQSHRYSDVLDEFYVPGFEDILPQSVTNKQGRAGTLSDNEKQAIQNIIADNNASSYKTYQMLLGQDVSENQDIGMVLSDTYNGLSKELARTVLPASVYTECYWKIDLHNLFNYMRLRCDSHAQKEIRVYADAMKQLVTPFFPESLRAFDDYVTQAKTFSRMELNILKLLLANVNVESLTMDTDMSTREIAGFKEWLSK